MERETLIYCRVSSERQEKEGHGLDSQEHRCREFAQAKGYQVVDDGEFRGVFRDSFTGGGDFMQRPGMSALLTYVDKNGHKDFVVVFDDLSRFARDVGAHFRLRQEFDERGILIDCPNFTFENTPEGELVETMMAAQHQYHRKNNRRQVIQKQKARLESGYWAFNAKDIPGYKRGDHPLHKWILVKNEPEASIIKEAFEGYADGRFVEQTDVLNYLRRNNFRGGKKIYLSLVKRLLTRVLYAGCIEFPDWEVSRRRGHHEAIVSLETFEKVQEKLEGKSYVVTRKDTTADFPLRGFVKCEHCKELLTASWSTGKTKKHPYYRCKNKACVVGNKSIRKDEMEGRFEDLLQEIVPTEAALKLTKVLFEKRWQKKISEFEKNTKGDVSRLKEVKERVELLSIRAAKAKNDTVAEKYEEQIGKLANEELLISEKIQSQQVTEKDFGTALNEVFGVIKSPYNLWVSEGMNSKRLALRLVFAEQIAYSSETGFGTPELSLPVRVFELIGTGKSLDVDLGRQYRNT